MATSGPQSRTWDPDVDTDTDDVEPDVPASPTGFSEADQAALAGFAAAWTRADDEADAPVEPAADETLRVTASPPSRATVHGVGVPGRGVVLGTFAALAAVVASDFALTGGMTVYFDLWFIVVCLIGAMSVRHRDLFTAGVLAPLAFGTLIGVVAVVSPSTFSDMGGFGRVFPTGLTEHAAGLVAGYAIALLTVGGRMAAGRR